MTELGCKEQEQTRISIISLQGVRVETSLRELQASDKLRNGRADDGARKVNT